MDYEITKVKCKPFQGDEGLPIDYFWTNAIRKSDGVSIQFGGLNDYTKSIGKVVKLNLEKVERFGGKIGYKEVR